MKMEAGALAGWCLVAVLACLPACEETLTEAECLQLRSKSFDVINDQSHDAPHTCNNDGECVATAWPECPKPVNTRNQKKIDEQKAKFDEGKCKEPEKSCRKAPRVYCKQGLCVFDEKPGQTNPG